MMSQKPRINFDDYTNDYSKMLRQQTGFFAQDENEFARHKVQIVREWTPREPRRILEFGCGIGGNISFLRAAFPLSEIMGSDISAASLDVARTNNPDVVFWQERSEAASHGEFDVILVAGVFHHIPPTERVRVARLLSSRLVRGGRVFVFEHNPYNPVTRHIVDRCPYDEDAILVKSGEMKNLLLEGGLWIEQQKFVLFFPRWLKWALPWERYLGWLPLGGQYWTLGRRRWVPDHQ